MNSKSEVKLTMFHTVVAFLTENAKVYENVKALNEFIGKLKTSLDKINEKNLEYLRTIDGKVADKNVSKDDLQDTLITISNVLNAFAVSTKNKEIEDVVSLSASAIKTLRSREIIFEAKRYITTIDKYKKELESYGISDELYKTFTTSIDNYSNTLNNKDLSYSNKPVIRKELEQLIDDTDFMLNKQIDPLIELFKKTTPDFYEKYYSARSIKDYTGTKKRTEKSEEVDNKS